MAATVLTNLRKQLIAANFPGLNKDFKGLSFQLTDSGDVGQIRVLPGGGDTTRDDQCPEQLDEEMSDCLYYDLLWNKGYMVVLDYALWEHLDASVDINYDGTTTVHLAIKDAEAFDTYLSDRGVE